MRKKNEQLTQQLETCKEDNRKSLAELQRKVDKITTKFTEEKENQGNAKTQKIIDSLKAIKGKLTKK